MEFTAAALGIVMLVIGLVLVLWKKKRKFERTNSAGIEQFQSFGGKLTATAFDGVLSWLSLSSLFVGLLILAMQYSETWGWIVLIPVCVVLLIFAT